MLHDDPSYTLPRLIASQDWGLFKLLFLQLLVEIIHFYSFIEVCLHLQRHIGDCTLVYLNCFLQLYLFLQVGQICTWLLQDLYYLIALLGKCLMFYLWDKLRPICQVYLSCFPSTIGCENRTLICIFRDIYSDVLGANIKLFRV